MLNVKSENLIFGPCSAESLDQLRDVASFLKSQNLKNMRMGTWKPRSRPGSFEGYGEKALSWAQEIQNEFELEIHTEVMNSHQVELCLKFGIKNFWIGARSSTNPHVVSEISAALCSDVKSIMVKNPLAPDLKLWMGAIERVNKKVPHTRACLRGFSTYALSGFRNEPLWDIAIELKKYMKELEVIVDSSHMAGKNELVAPISQMALDLKFDGLMVEVHPHPKLALSDSEQQLNLEQIKDLLLNLEGKKDISSNSDNLRELENLRSELDEIDIEILHMIKQRQNVVKKVGSLKKKHNLAVFSHSRFYNCLESRLDSADKMGLSRDLCEKTYRLLHSHSLASQSYIKK